MDKYSAPKGQLISKRNSQAEDSPKKRTNEFVFTSMQEMTLLSNEFWLIRIH
jgi:hypothetical protein